jgi:hypothetical protein
MLSSVIFSDTIAREHVDMYVKLSTFVFEPTGLLVADNTCAGPVSRDVVALIDV